MILRSEISIVSFFSDCHDHLDGLLPATKSTNASWYGPLNFFKTSSEIDIIKHKFNQDVTVFR
jgi:hypothetical protein